MYSDSSLKDQFTAIEAENKYLANVYFRYAITIVRGNGSSIWDDQGKEYIDCMGGYGVSVVGHNCRVIYITSPSKNLKNIKNLARTTLRSHDRRPCAITT